MLSTENKIENLRNRIDEKLANDEKEKCTSKPSYMSHKIFDNNLVVAICKSKLALNPNKPTYIGMCILECE